jgi:hypothetical protein
MSWLDNARLMSKSAKVAVVIAGYALALICAFAYFYVYPNPEAAAYPGMAAFGDSIVFLGIFGFVGLFPTTLALYFLRPFNRFWLPFAMACLVFAISGPLVEIANTALDARRAYDHSPMAAVLSLIGILHIFGTPLFFIGFIIFSAIAPPGRPRRLMLLSAAMEVLTGGYAFFTLLIYDRFF